MEAIHNDPFTWNGTLASLYGIYACYNDLLFDQHRFAPILAISGPPGSGKSLLARSVVKFFDQDFHGNDISTMTPAHISFFCGPGGNRGVFWVDEWRNDLPLWKQEFVKQSYYRLRPSIEHPLKSVRYNSALIISGQSVPGTEESDPAIFSRCIHLSTEFLCTNDFSLDLLTDQWKRGFREIHKKLTGARQIMSDENVDKVADIQRKLKDRLSEYDARMVLNYSILLAPALVLKEAGVIELTMGESELIEIAVMGIEKQMEDLANI